MFELLNSSIKLKISHKTFIKSQKRMSILKSSIYKNITLNNLKISY